MVEEVTPCMTAEMMNLTLLGFDGRSPLSALMSVKLNEKFLLPVVNVTNSNLTVLLKFIYVKLGDPHLCLLVWIPIRPRDSRPTKAPGCLCREERQPSGNSQKSASRRRRRNRHGPPSNGPSSNGTEEQAESEVPTIDPSVDPDELDEAPPLGRQQPQRGAHPVRLGGRREAGVGGSGGPGGSPSGSN